MEFNFEALGELYFAYDDPVPYQLKTGATLFIRPVLLKDSVIFIQSCDLLDIDKNSSSDVEAIQMSYLRYLSERVLQHQDEQIAKASKQKLVNICILCLGMELPYLAKNERGKLVLCDLKHEAITVTEKEFEDVRRIIMHQNFADYDDEYIDPDLKKAMNEVKALKAAKFAPISTERRMNIVMAHCGYSKDAIKSMTYRAFNNLYAEVIGEVDFSATWPIALYTGKTKDVAHWIYRERKDKYSEYIKPLDEYKQSIGADGKIRASGDTSNGDALDALFNQQVNKQGGK